MTVCVCVITTSQLLWVLRSEQQQAGGEQTLATVHTDLLEAEPDTRISNFQRRGESGDKVEV